MPVGSWKWTFPDTKSPQMVRTFFSIRPRENRLDQNDHRKISQQNLTCNFLIENLQHSLPAERECAKHSCPMGNRHWKNWIIKICKTTKKSKLENQLGSAKQRSKRFKTTDNAEFRWNLENVHSHAQNHPKWAEHIFQCVDVKTPKNDQCKISPQNMVGNFLIDNCLTLKNQYEGDIPRYFPRTPLKR